MKMFGSVTCVSVSHEVSFFCFFIILMGEGIYNIEMFCSLISSHLSWIMMMMMVMVSQSVFHPYHHLLNSKRHIYFAWFIDRIVNRFSFSFSNRSYISFIIFRLDWICNAFIYDSLRFTIWQFAFAFYT